MIKYPRKKATEAEIQALLWQRLKDIGLDARLQVKAEKSRLDIVIFKGKVAICIIECKDWSPSYIRNRKYRLAHNTRQITKYKTLFQIPVFLCGCLQAIEPVSKLAQSVYEQS